MKSPYQLTDLFDDIVPSKEELEISLEGLDLVTGAPTVKPVTEMAALSLVDANTTDINVTLETMDSDMEAALEDIQNNGADPQAPPPPAPIRWTIAAKGNEVEMPDDVADKIIVTITNPYHPMVWSIVNALVNNPWVSSNYELHIIAPTNMRTHDWFTLGSFAEMFPLKTVFHMGVTYGIEALANLAKFDEILISDASALYVVNSIRGAMSYGTVVDAEDSTKLLEHYYAEVKRRLLAANLLTEEEITDVFENESVYLLSGALLKERIANKVLI